MRFITLRLTQGKELVCYEPIPWFVIDRVMLMDNEPRCIWNKTKVGREYRCVESGPGLLNCIKKPETQAVTQIAEFGCDYMVCSECNTVMRSGWLECFECGVLCVYDEEPGPHELENKRSYGYRWIAEVLDVENDKMWARTNIAAEAENEANRKNKTSMAIKIARVLDRPDPTSVCDLPVEACKCRDIKVHGKRPTDVMGPEDTADVLKYSGVELTEDKKMDKTVDIREKLKRVKALQEEQRKHKEEKEQKEME